MGGKRGGALVTGGTGGKGPPERIGGGAYVGAVAAGGRFKTGAYGGSGGAPV